MEIEKRIETLNKREFFINMSVRLTNHDWEMLREIEEERNELKKKLN